MVVIKQFLKDNLIFKEKVTLLLVTDIILHLDQITSLTNIFVGKLVIWPLSVFIDLM